VFVMRLLVQSSKGELTRLGVLVAGKRAQAGTEAMAR
jgi:cobalt/nickel transport system permease protein